MPPPFSLEELDAFLDRQGERYAVDWNDMAGRPGQRRPMGVVAA
jgi:hypothetical protein